MWFLKKIKGIRKIKKKYPVNFTNDFLFIHIPKNGGSSLVKAFGFKGVTHIKAQEIINTNRSELLRSRFSFAIARHPYDRFLSLYNYARMPISHYHNNIEPEKAKHGIHLDYKLLKDASLLECAQLLKKGKLKHDLAWNQWEPQVTWIFDSSDKCLVSKIYQLENLKELEVDFLEKFQMNLKIPIVNKSQGEKEDLSQEVKMILDVYYDKDFKLLNYKKGL
ncbi:sulfotransferase family 2 domain-containing protein [Winogradskyella rapida]|uniref:Sulfotransferase family 2 domain-containing protein n=1 Tax=Winogradskyella rapida TaxID=549701 RepID=A0ABW3KPU6_9FLAO